MVGPYPHPTHAARDDSADGCHRGDLRGRSTRCGTVLHARPCGHHPPGRPQRPGLSLGRRSLAGGRSPGAGHVAGPVAGGCVRARGPLPPGRGVRRGQQPGRPSDPSVPRRRRDEGRRGSGGVAGTDADRSARSRFADAAQHRPRRGGGRAHRHRATGGTHLRPRSRGDVGPDELHRRLPVRPRGARLLLSRRRAAQPRVRRHRPGAGEQLEGVRRRGWTGSSRGGAVRRRRRFAVHHVDDRAVRRGGGLVDRAALRQADGPRSDPAAVRRPRGRPDHQGGPGLRRLAPCRRGRQ